MTRRAQRKWRRYGLRARIARSRAFFLRAASWRETGMRVEFGVNGVRSGTRMQENRVQLRMLIIAGCVALWMTAVFGRLGYLQLIRHSEYLTRAHRQQQRTIEITPKRGAIFDRNMHPLAMSTEVESAFAIPTELGDNRQQAARLLSGVLEVPREVLEEKFNSGSTFVWVSRKLPPEKSDAVKALNLKGIYTMKENQRF